MKVDLQNKVHTMTWLNKHYTSLLVSMVLSCEKTQGSSFCARRAWEVSKVMLPSELVLTQRHSLHSSPSGTERFPFSSLLSLAHFSWTNCGRWSSSQSPNFWPQLLQSFAALQELSDIMSDIWTSEAADHMRWGTVSTQKL